MNPDTAARLLLIAQEGQARRSYENALSTVGIPLDTVSDVDAFFQAVTSRPYSAILVDIPTKVMALKDHRDVVHKILSCYPVIQLSVEPDTGRIRALRLGHRQKAADLQTLLTPETLLPVPMIFRDRRRDALHFNVLMSSSPVIEAAGAIRSVTLAVSESACFLYDAGDRVLPDTMWIRLLELSDATPIRVSVRRRVPWGGGMRLPGIEVRFETLSPQQQAELDRIRSPVRPRATAAPSEATEGLLPQASS